MDRQRQKCEGLKARIVQGLILHAHCEKEASLQMLEEALELAEHGSFLRLFADEGMTSAGSFAGGYTKKEVSH